MEPVLYCTPVDSYSRPLELALSRLQTVRNCDGWHFSAVTPSAKTSMSFPGFGCPALVCYLFPILKVPGCLTALFLLFIKGNFLFLPTRNIQWRCSVCVARYFFNSNSVQYQLIFIRDGLRARVIWESKLWTLMETISLSIQGNNKAI